MNVSQLISMGQMILFYKMVASGGVQESGLELAFGQIIIY